VRLSAVLFLSVFLLASCNQQKKRLIGVVPKATSHVFWVAVEKGAKAAAKEFQVDIEWNGAPSETEYARQIQIVDSMINRKVDGLAVAATERRALVASVDRAMKQGIPVTIFDSGIEGENYTSYVATNNYEGGQLGARAMAKLIGGKGEVGLILHAPGSASTMDRERGFTDVIEKEFPEIKIVATQYGMADRSKARAGAENILTAHPNLSGFFGSSEPSTTGASLAVKARGLAGKVKVVAFDASDNLVEDMKAGAIQAMVVQDPFQMGYQTVKTLIDKLDGKTPPKRIDLSAKVIFADEVSKPENQRLLSPELK
jgi:ribose transport system substrate-binding protein